MDLAIRGLCGEMIAAFCVHTQEQSSQTLQLTHLVICPRRLQQLQIWRRHADAGAQHHRNEGRFAGFRHTLLRA